MENIENQSLGQMAKALLSPLDYSRDNGFPDIKWPQTMFYGACIGLAAIYSTKRTIVGFGTTVSALIAQSPKLGGYSIAYAPLACILIDQCYRNYCFNDLQSILREEDSRGEKFFEQYTPEYIHQKWIALTISYVSSIANDTDVSDGEKKEISSKITESKKGFLKTPHFLRSFMLESHK